MPSDVFSFLVDQLLLVLAAAFLLAWLVLDFVLDKKKGRIMLDVREAATRAARKRVAFVDVRTSDERTRGGHIIDDHHCPDKDTFDRLIKNSSADAIVLYCTAGVKARKQATAAAKQYADKPIFFLKGGLHAWTNENYPITKS